MTTRGLGSIDRLLLKYYVKEFVRFRIPIEYLKFLKEIYSSVNCQMLTKV